MESRRFDMRGLSRRAVLGVGAIGVWGGLSPLAIAQNSGFEWRRFRGERIEVSLVRNPRNELLQRYQNEFETMTGIGVGFELVGDQQHRQKQVVEFSSGTPGFDVTSISYHAHKRLFAKGKWLADLRPLLSDPNATSPEFDYKDFSPSALAFAAPGDGRIDSIPVSLDYFMIYWNRAMFEAAGLAYPSDFSQILAAAQKLTDPGKRQFGWVARGLKNANTYIWASLMLGWGEEIIKPNGELNTTGAAALAAAEFYTKLGREFSPPGSIGFNWSECQSSFMQGTIGMWPDISGFAAPLEDPSKSRLPGKVGYGVVPPGPRAHAAAMTGDGIGIAAASRKQGPAFLYVQWATSKLNQARVLQTGAGTGARISTYSDPAVLSAVRASKDWIDSVKRSAEIAKPSLPDVIVVGEFRDVFGVALANMLGGADPAVELKKATEQFRPILERS